MSSHSGYYRGSYRGYGRERGGKSGRGGGSGSLVGVGGSGTASREPLGPAIDTINIKTLLTEEEAPTITNVEYVASYNWIDGKSPVILVPGQ
jgi:hypothetical protein